MELLSRRNTARLARAARGCLLAGAAFGALATGALAEDAPSFDALPGPPSWDALPDWTGVWREDGNTIFDSASVEPPGAGSGQRGAREHPPLTDAWEAKYQAALALRDEGMLPDPITNCGIPVGFPRIFNVPDVYELVVRPEQTWILTENGPNVMRIYTDGRSHPAPEDMWPTYTGDSVGYWEGDTLVFSTVGVKSDAVILDRTGLQLSNEMKAVTRMRKTADDRIEIEMTFEDPLALKSPWRVVTRLRRLEEGTRAYDYACAENQRNPVDEEGNTLILDAEGKPLND